MCRLSFPPNLSSTMNERDKLIAKYAIDLKEKCRISPDMDLLTKVTIECGPSIYNIDSSIISTSSPSQLKTIRNKFLVGRLGLSFNDNLDEGIAAVLAQYGVTNSIKYRAVMYYLLVQYFKKEYRY
jgi:hypothetical protein